MTLKLIVFDCDGTLIDSQAVIVTCMAQAFESAGLSAPPDEAVRQIIGLSLPRAVGMLAPEADEPTVDDLVALYKAHFTTVQQGALIHEPMFPGARDALDALGAAGHLLAVATGKSRRGLFETLARHDLADRFVSLQTADDAPGKPHPGMLEQAMAETGAAPAETVLVGDTTFDMQMAVNAGVAPIGVSWGYHPTAQLNASGAVAVIDAFSELVPLVTGWRKPGSA